MSYFPASPINGESEGTGLSPAHLHDENKNLTTLKNKTGKTGMNDLSSSETTCFLCREKDSPERDCKVCQNIRTYRSKNSEHSNPSSPLGGDNEVNVSFPGPGIVKRNAIYGNYVVASRTIMPGELIILERPLTIAPYCPADVLPLCLSCCKDIGLSSKCSVCKWPVCDSACEKFYLHAENECKIFAKCGIKSKGVLNEYFSVEALRALLLRERNAHAWQSVLEFEPHIDARLNDYRAKAATDFIISFIRDKCQLSDQFAPEVIDHVVGILSINTFWAFKELNSYASCLFDKITLFAHDCDPNTERRLMLAEREGQQDIDANRVSSIALQVTASREIAPGEMITIRYIDVNKTLVERREELKETFYFDCTCSRCLCEIMKNDNHNNNIEAKLLELSI